MSVAAVTSTSSADTSLLSSLGVSTTGTTSIATDLQNYTSAKSSGNSSTADAAIVQLKKDLTSEQASLFSSMVAALNGDSSTSSTSTSDIGDNLLSTLSSGTTSSTAQSVLSRLQSQSTSTTGSQISVTA